MKSIASSSSIWLRRAKSNVHALRIVHTSVDVDMQIRPDFKYFGIFRKFVILIHTVTT